LTVQVSSGERQVIVPGIVDSGADGTLLPMGVARRLGIDATLTANAANAGAAGGQGFPIWRSSREIHGQIMALLDTRPEPWGPRFLLKPAFAETSASLLGRDDFFRVFRITFEHDSPDGHIFHVDA
jgi:hypothetical protein